MTVGGLYHAIMIMVQRPEGDPAVIDVNDAERLVVLHTLPHSSQRNYSGILAAFNYFLQQKAAEMFEVKDSFAIHIH